jgi:hypothetical protein
MASAAVAWASALVEAAASANSNAQQITLEVDMLWLARANAAGPFAAKEVYLQVCKPHSQACRLHPSAPSLMCVCACRR